MKRLVVFSEMSFYDFPKDLLVKLLSTVQEDTLKKDTFVYIAGDRKYTSYFYILMGEDRVKIIERIVDLAILRGQFDGWIFPQEQYEFSNIVENWDDDQQFRNFLIKSLMKDLTYFNGSLDDEIYFYISVHPIAEWYKHFQHLHGHKNVEILYF